MSTTTCVTAQQLFETPDDGQRRELIAGEVQVMALAGWRHGKTVSNIHGLLWHHITPNQLGVLFGAETGFLLSREPDTVRAPDVAFIARENIPDQEPQESYWPAPPDLAVEVLSPSDSTGDVDDKIQAWLMARSRAVWVVDPKLQTVTIYKSKTDVQIRTAGEQLEGETVPGFSCPVDEMFASH